MGKYLDKISRTIGRRQTDQVLSLLNKQRNSGEIRSVEEFSKKLESLVRELTSTTLKPSLGLYEAQINRKIDSDSYNFMLDRAEDDLFAGFEEANNIAEVQQSHQAIVKDLLLKNIRSAIAELESKISIYEYLNQDVNGFDSALFNTFREIKEGRTFRDSRETKSLFVDPRNSEVFPLEQDAQVELIGERLILANSFKEEHDIRGIRQIFDISAAQSELIVEPPNLSLNNVIDGTTGTYWMQALLFTKPQKEITLKFELDLGISKEVNYIDIEPVTKYGLVLDSINYIDSVGSLVTITSNDLKFDGPVSVRFAKTTARFFILVFKNTHSAPVQFEYNETKNNLFEQVFLEPAQGFNGNIKNITDIINEIIPSADIKNMLGITIQPASKFVGYEFLTGFDNIRCGLSDHKDTSVFISHPLEATDIKQIGIKTLEGRPYEEGTNPIAFTNQTYDHDIENASRYFLGSIEYWIIKQDFNINSILLQTNIFPILPLDVVTIKHERLLLTTKSNASFAENDLGQTIFFTNVTNGAITIYRNGVPLVYTTDWVWHNSSVITDRTPGQGSIMKFQIRIISSRPNEIYTVSYKPIVSTTTTIPTTLGAINTVGGLQVVDLSGDLSVRAGPGQKVYVSNQEGEAEHKIYLMVILRQNTAESSLSPAVEEYILVTGIQDSTKFSET